MEAYQKLASLVSGITPTTSEQVLTSEVIPYLVDLWIERYDHEGAEIIETSVEGFSYLFDVARGRLIAAWGFSRGRYAGARDRSRMAGHPLSAGPHYHRGHAIPHTLGGPTDINLVAQLGSVNVGPFRVLERQAVASPGALYFTHWIYKKGSDQKPIAVEQGLLIPGAQPVVRTHPN